MPQKSCIKSVNRTISCIFHNLISVFYKVVKFNNLNVSRTIQSQSSQLRASPFCRGPNMAAVENFSQSSKIPFSRALPSPTLRSKCYQLFLYLHLNNNLCFLFPPKNFSYESSWKILNNCLYKVVDCSAGLLFTISLSDCYVGGFFLIWRLQVLL